MNMSSGLTCMKHRDRKPWKGPNWNFQKSHASRRGSRRDIWPSYLLDLEETWRISLLELRLSLNLVFLSLKCIKWSLNCDFRAVAHNLYSGQFTASTSPTLVVDELTKLITVLSFWINSSNHLFPLQNDPFSVAFESLRLQFSISEFTTHLREHFKHNEIVPSKSWDVTIICVYINIHIVFNK